MKTDGSPAQEPKPDDPDAPLTGEKHADAPGAGSEFWFYIPISEQSTNDTLGTGAAPAVAGRDDTGASERSNSQDHPDKAKKAGFMAKMKGEAKVLLGKVEGKKEKVEEGQRIKAGETVSH